MKKTLKSIMSPGKKILGTILQLPSEELAEILGYAGLDIIVLDMEHCPTTPGKLVSLIRACEAADVLPFVRVPDVTDEDSIKKALDAGAGGIVVPNVDSVEQARKAVEYGKFAPIGNRGACPFVRANRFGQKDRSKYYEEANRETAIMVLVEGIEGVKALPEIAKVEGIDALQIGAVDLSVAMGVPGQTTHPKVKEAIRQAAQIAADNGKTICFYCDDVASAQEVKDWPGVGIYILPVVEDVLGTQYGNMIKQIREFS